MSQEEEIIVSVAPENEGSAQVACPPETKEGKPPLKMPIAGGSACGLIFLPPEE